MIWQYTLSHLVNSINQTSPTGKVDCILSNPPDIYETLLNEDDFIVSGRHTQSKLVASSVVVSSRLVNGQCATTSCTTSYPLPSEVVATARFAKATTSQWWIAELNIWINKAAGIKDLKTRLRQWGSDDDDDDVDNNRRWRQSAMTTTTMKSHQPAFRATPLFTKSPCSSTIILYKW